MEKINVVADDPSDNKFIEAGVAGKADVIVSGDSHLLELKSFRGIPIVPAQKFIEQLEGQ